MATHSAVVTKLVIFTNDVILSVKESTLLEKKQEGASYVSDTINDSVNRL